MGYLARADGGGKESTDEEMSAESVDRKGRQMKRCLQKVSTDEEMSAVKCRQMKRCLQ